MVRETLPETVFLLWCRLTGTDPYGPTPERSVRPLAAASVPEAA